MGVTPNSLKRRRQQWPFPPADAPWLGPRAPRAPRGSPGKGPGWGHTSSCHSGCRPGKATALPGPETSSTENDEGAQRVSG